MRRYIVVAIVCLACSESADVTAPHAATISPQDKGNGKGDPHTEGGGGGGGATSGAVWIDSTSAVVPVVSSSVTNASTTLWVADSAGNVWVGARDGSPVVINEVPVYYTSSDCSTTPYVDASKLTPPRFAFGLATDWTSGGNDAGVLSVLTFSTYRTSPDTVLSTTSITASSTIGGSAQANQLVCWTIFGGMTISAAALASDLTTIQPPTSLFSGPVHPEFH